MVGQMLRRLWEAEAAGRGRYVVAVSGDHSTPVMFGDHSNEPVPFVICNLRHAIEVRVRLWLALTTVALHPLLSRYDGREQKSGDAKVQPIVYPCYTRAGC